MIQSTYNSLYPINLEFCSIQSSDDLLKTTTSARLGLNAEPKSFEKLNNLIKFLYPEQSSYAFEHFYPKAEKVLNGQAFQNLPGPLRRLTPLALNYVQALEPVEKALTSDPLCIESIRRNLSHFIEAHTQFKELFTLECENASPAAPFTVLSRYPNALRLYFIAFIKQLSVVSPRIYMSWRESIENKGEEVVDLFPQLAIHYLLEKPQYPIPELFVAHNEKIATLRTTYTQLSTLQKSKLLETICQVSAPIEQHEDLPVKSLEFDREVHYLFLQIGRLCSDIQVANRNVFNGVVRIIYQETAKVFSLLDHMDIKSPPETLEIGFRALFLSLLKQDTLSPCQLPFDFSGKDTNGDIQGETLAANVCYQALPQKEKEKFNTLFMRGDNNVKDYPSLNDLLRKFDRISWLLASRPTIFPLQILTMLSYKRSNQ